MKQCKDHRHVQFQGGPFNWIYDPYYAQGWSFRVVTRFTLTLIPVTDDAHTSAYFGQGHLKSISTESTAKDELQFHSEGNKQELHKET